MTEKEKPKAPEPYRDKLGELPAERFDNEAPPPDAETAKHPLHQEFSKKVGQRKPKQS